MLNRSIRTLFITKLPFPPMGGEHLRSWQNINILSQFGPVHVFSIFRYDYDESQIGTVETWRSYNVNQQPFPWNKLEPILWWIQKRGLWDYWPFRYSAARQLDDMLTVLKPDLVVIEELWLYPYLAIAQRHGCPVIFDHHNVEALLFEATKCEGNGLRGWLRSHLHLPQIKADEAEFMRQADQTWVCSRTDSQRLAKLYDEQPENCELTSRYVVPNAINLDDYAQIRSGKCDAPADLPADWATHPHTLLYLGNFGFVPNAEAAEILITQIYPRIKNTYEDIRLLMVGRDPTPLMMDAFKKDGNITVTGRVSNIMPYLAVGSVMVVPLQKGSGTRLKVLEAFAAGCPVVSTAKGVEGLAVKDGQHLLIREDAEAIANGVMHLWQHHTQAQLLTAAAYELVRANYSWEASGREVKKALSKLFAQEWESG